ncbi:hypothetical protein OPIT5_23745 [Opitutaceae bacterium TAV5]|nr:hypothetical protein OPIT5_23745 [Opitutaceae bacterium TAV5]
MHLSLAAVGLATVCGEVVGGEWQQLARLPDPVGFGGMFAGVLDGALVTGGGSRFVDRPLWQGGTKGYGEKIYVLASPDGRWSESEARLPKGLGHFAVAAARDEIYLLGGLSAEGYEAACHRIGWSGGQIVVSRLPDLPAPLGYGVAAVAGGRVVVAGGQHAADARRMNTRVWSLDPRAPAGGWRREADLPGSGVIVPCAAAQGDHFYLFGGLAYDGDGRPSPSSGACRYDLAKRVWRMLPAMPEARVAAATPCPVLEDGRILIAGGYADVFGGPPREHPGFSTGTFLYNVSSGEWETGAVLPAEPFGERDGITDTGLHPVAAAAGAYWRGRAVIVGGETRPSARTAAVLAWRFRSARASAD